MSQPRLLFIADTAAYGSLTARETLDMALAAAAFDQPTALLLRGPAVLWLQTGQAGELLGQKTLARNLGALPLYGVERLFADLDALQAYGLDPQALATPWQPLEASAINILLRQAQQVIQL